MSFTFVCQCKVSNANRSRNLFLSNLIWLFIFFFFYLTFCIRHFRTKKRFCPTKPLLICSLVFKNFECISRCIRLLMRQVSHVWFRSPSGLLQASFRSPCGLLQVCGRIWWASYCWESQLEMLTHRLTEALTTLPVDTKAEPNFEFQRCSSPRSCIFLSSLFSETLTWFWFPVSSGTSRWCIGDL